MSKLTPEQRLSKARVALMTHPKFCALSGIMLMGKVIEHGDTADMFVTPRHRETAAYIEGRYG